MNIRLQETNMSDVQLVKWISERDQGQYPRIADYLYAASEKLQAEDTVTISIKLGTLTEEELKAITLLLNHKEEKTEGSGDLWGNRYE